MAILARTPMTPGNILRSAQAHANGFAARAGFVPFHAADAESTLGTRFREVALRRDSATALVDGDARISYSELLRRAGDVAANLRAQCGDGGGIIGICLSSGLATIETILGALLGGFGYFCLDSSLPEPQIAALSEAAGLLALVRGETINLESRGRSAALEFRGPRGIAALYATSGSTGEPTMVALSHRAVLFDIGRQTNDLYLGPDDRFDSLFSFAFSASLATIFGALLNGAELHHHDPRPNLPGLLDWLDEHRISISSMTVSMLRHICLAAPAQSGCPSLRLLSVGGEELHASDVEAFRSVFPPGCVLQNAMASTETRTYAQYFITGATPVESPIPIGWPVAGKNVSLLDENGAPVADGNEGEIAVRSEYLANGYSNDSQRTATKFEAQPDGTVIYRTGDRGRFRTDGSLVFLGRTDSQVKIRGHRVELEAVARAIGFHPQVRTSVVVARRDSASNDRLVAYIVPVDPGCAPAVAGLRELLKQKLPDYMLPEAFVMLSNLPMTPNGKIDRKALPEPDGLPAGSDQRYGPPRSPVEAALAEIWSEVFGLTQVGVDDEFLELGGHSLLAMQVVSGVRRVMGVEIPLRKLFEGTTIAGLAEYVNDAMHPGAPS